MGFSADVTTPGGTVHLALAFNPSHLEIVDPVVVGTVRARQTHRRDEERKQVVPVLIHGDAAFAGQGVVMELLKMSQARGFCVGGTIHVVINNQVGFTTSDRRRRALDAVLHRRREDGQRAGVPRERRRSRSGGVRARELAFDFRQQFKQGRRRSTSSAIAATATTKPTSRPRRSR